MEAPEIWLNNRAQMHKQNAVKKPCYATGNCPYGQLVEAFTLRADKDKVSCKFYGHDCPAYYLTEKNMTEETGVPNANKNKMRSRSAGAGQDIL